MKDVNAFAAVILGRLVPQQAGSVFFIVAVFQSSFVKIAHAGSYSSGAIIFKMLRRSDNVCCAGTFEILEQINPS